MKLKLFILILGLQTAWILGAVAWQEHVRNIGKVILIEAGPGDPRDYLRGDFIRLNYKISSVPPEKFTPPLTSDLPAGTKIYVALAPAGAGEFWEVKRAGLKPLTPAADEVRLLGKAQRNWRLLKEYHPPHYPFQPQPAQRQQSFPRQNNVPIENNVSIEYGIGKYFVAEGTGHPLGKLTAEVSVAPSGRASLKEVFVDGAPYAEAMKAAEK